MTMQVPLSLKMSATWENEKLSSSIVPRICNLSITQVMFDRLVEEKLDNSRHFLVAVRMRDNTRRVLRSPELAFPSIMPGIVCLNFSCSIQYSHALKRDSSNLLQLLIQRPKKYKKKSVNFGYKTLAYCTIDLAQVLQRKIENKILDLYEDPKSFSHVVGRIEVQSLSTSPAEKDLISDRRKEFYEEEDEGMHEQFSEAEDSDRGEDSDFDPNLNDYPESRQKKMIKNMNTVGGDANHRRSSSPSAALPEWQKQIKQKIMGLLKKVKLMEHNEVLDPRDQIWDEIDQFENASEDSDIGDMDTLSIQSTPRPMLRPFFNTASLATGQHALDNPEDTLNTDGGAKLLKKLQMEQQVKGQRLNLSASNGMTTDNLDKDRSIDSMHGEAINDDQQPQHQTPTLAAQQPTTTTSKQSKSKFSKHNNQQTSQLGATSTTQSQFNPTTSFTTSTAPTASVSASYMATTLVSAVNTICGASSGTNVTITTSKSKKPISSIIKTLSLVTSPSPNSHHTQQTHTHQQNPQANSTGVNITSSSVITSPTPCDQLRCESFGSTGYDFVKQNDTNPRTELIEQVNNYLLEYSDFVHPIYLISLADIGGKYVSDLFIKENIHHILLASYGDTKYAITQIISRIRKRTDSIRLCLLGGDFHLNNILRVYIDQININYSNDVLSCFRFYLIPISALSNTNSPAYYNCNNTVAKRLCSIDAKYSNSFAEYISPNYSSMDLLDPSNTSSNIGSGDNTVVERDNRFLFAVQDYLQSRQTVNLPIGECLISTKASTITEGNNNTEYFLPFIAEVRLGELTLSELSAINHPPATLRMDNSMDEQSFAGANVVAGNSSGANPSTTAATNSSCIGNSPPRSPIINNLPHSINLSSSLTKESSIGMQNPSSNASVIPQQQPQTSAEFPITNNSPTTTLGASNLANYSPSNSELVQLEYWTDHSSKKNGVKSSFRQMIVYPPTLQHTNLLNLTIISREKKQKIIRIAKKQKHETGDTKKETFDDVNRILCSCKNQTAEIKVSVDGVIWSNVKFFQLSPSWRTQTKTFSIASFNT